MERIVGIRPRAKSLRSAWFLTIESLQNSFFLYLCAINGLLRAWGKTIEYSVNDRWEACPWHYAGGYQWGRV